MDSKVEEMIRMAAADGVITDAEKAIIIKKAKELGEDPDMVELAIEGEIGSLHKEEKRVEAKGQKCPNCGEIIPAGQVACPLCGFALIHSEVNSTAMKLQKDLANIREQLQEDLRKIVERKKGYNGLFAEHKDYDLKRNAYHNMFSRIVETIIPNSRADLLELLAFTESRADKFGPQINQIYNEDMSYAYWILFENCIKLARVSFGDDQSFQHFFSSYDTKYKEKLGFVRLFKRIFLLD